LKEADVAPAKSKTHSHKSPIPAVTSSSASSAPASGRAKKLTAKQAIQQGIKPHLGPSASGIKAGRAKAAASGSGPTAAKTASAATSANKAAKVTASPKVAAKSNVTALSAAANTVAAKGKYDDLPGKIDDLLNTLTEFPFQVDVGGPDGSEQLGGGINGSVVDNALRSALGSIPANPAQLAAALNSRFIGHAFENRVIYDWKPVPVATNVSTSDATLPALTLLRDRTESAKAVLDLVAEIKPLKAAPDPENCEAARNVVAIKFRELLTEFSGIPRPDKVEDCFRVLGIRPRANDDPATVYTIWTDDDGTEYIFVDIEFELFSKYKANVPFPRKQDFGAVARMRKTFGLFLEAARTVQEELDYANFFTIRKTLGELFVTYKQYEKGRDNYFSSDLPYLSRARAAAADALYMLEAAMDRVGLRDAERSDLPCNDDPQFTIQQYFDWAEDFLNRESIELIDKGEVDGISSLAFTLSKLTDIALNQVATNPDPRVQKGTVQRAIGEFITYLQQAWKIASDIAQRKKTLLPPEVIPV
jgi:hypothetical protein